MTVRPTANDIDALDGAIERLWQHIDKMEARHKRVYMAIQAYVRADMEAIWMSSARELDEALTEALKDG